MKSTLNEKIWLSIIFIVFTTVLTFVLFYYHIRGQYGDGTFAAQMLNNLKYYNGLISSYGSSTLEVYKTVWYKDADFVCSLPLSFKGKDNPLFFHFYGVAYLLKPLSQFVNTYILVALLQALSFSSVLLFTYLFSRKKGINVICSLLFVFLVSQHPVWRYGIYGQFYFNQLFLPLIALVVWQLDNRKNNFLLLFASTFLALSVNEVYGILVFLIYISYFIFFKRDKSYVYLGLFSLLVSVLLILIIQINQGSNSTQNGFFSNLFSASMFNVIKNSLLRSETAIFILVNLLSVGIFTFSSWKTLALLILFLAPNLLVDIGGADKVGWSTHYHISYFIPLIWISLIGFSILYKKKKYCLLGVFIILALSFNYYINPYNLRFNKQGIAIKSIYNYFKYYLKNGKVELAYREQLRNTVKNNESVSAPETAVYNLMDREIYYYPINIDSVDKVIFHYSKADVQTKGLINSLYTPNWGQQDNHLDKCIITRMKKSGFDFNNPTIIGDFVVITRI